MSEPSKRNSKPNKPNFKLNKRKSGLIRNKSNGNDWSYFCDRKGLTQTTYLTRKTDRLLPLGSLRERLLPISAEAILKAALLEKA